MLKTLCLGASVFLAGCASGPGGISKASDPTAAAMLAPCPARPSCVVSRDDAGPHAITALRFAGDSGLAIQRLSAILKSMPRTRIVGTDGNYLHAVQESRWLRYTDDVEFLVDAQRGRIDVRSCARVGYYDFGVNRSRIEAIRAQLQK